MARQTAAAQKRAEAEAKKAAKATAGLAAANSAKHSGNGQAASLAAPHSNNITVSKDPADSGVAPELTSLTKISAQQPKADTHTRTDSEKVVLTAAVAAGGKANTAARSAEETQEEVGSDGVTDSGKQDENQAMNKQTVEAAAAGSNAVVSSHAAKGQAKPGRKRAAGAADPADAVPSKRNCQKRSANSK